MSETKYSAWAITDIILRTVDLKSHGQNIIVLVRLDDGREVEVIREFGALPDVSIDHYVSYYGIDAAIVRHSKAPSPENPS